MPLVLSGISGRTSRLTKVAPLPLLTTKIAEKKSASVSLAKRAVTSIGLGTTSDKSSAVSRVSTREGDHLGNAH
jgi:hypothetical protein